MNILVNAGPPAPNYSKGMPTKARIELDAGSKTFASGLLPALIAALRQSRPGELLAVTSREAGLGPAIEAWCRFTNNALIETTAEAGRLRWVSMALKGRSRSNQWTQAA